MRNISVASSAKRLSTALCAATLLASAISHAQEAQTARARPSDGGGALHRVSVADGQGLLSAIKDVESPAFRAYLYSQVASWLWRNAGDDQNLRLSAVEAATRGISDLQEHEREIPPAPAFMFYEEFLGIVRKHSPSEAARLEKAHPLQLKVNRAEQEKASGELYAALGKLSDPRTAERGLDEALRLIGSGNVPVTSLHGELLRQDRLNSPALPQLLSATLALEERSAGSVPLLNLFFLSSVYLKDSTPADIRARFLAASVAATRHVTPEQRSDPRVINWAIQLLRTVIPHLQKSSPALHAEAAARLANFAPGASREEDIYNRIRDSADPLAEALSEADATSDPRKKRELRQVAARLARQQGKLRQAAELIVSAEDERRAPSEDYSGRDEFLDGILVEALAGKDVEVARFAASKIALPVNQAAASRRLARYFHEAKDARSAAEHLNEAAKSLRDAPEGNNKAVAYLHLAADFTELDAPRAPELLREAVKATNSIPRPREDSGGEFSWKLFPVADAVTTAFRRLAKADRASAFGLTNDLQPKELKVAAALGIYGDPLK